jgi:hypothetical protein
MMTLNASVESNNLVTTLEDLYSLEVFQSSPPVELWVDDRETKFVSSWIEKYVKNAKRNVWVNWRNPFKHKIVYRKDHILGISIKNLFNDFKEVLIFLSPLPWSVIAIGSINESWFDEEISYNAPGFANLHADLGAGCAFKGEGHNRVVSRRYLDYGPWHVIRDEANDITLIQFHDLNADALTALEQAKPGHKLMGDPYEGGFIQRDYQILNDDFSGLYSPTEKMLRFIINDRPITRAELLDACAARLWQLLGEDRPIKRVGYVFIIEEEARQNLHELWLRDIECWTYIEGIETRIDQDYTPPLPQKPEWVQRLEVSSAA